MKMSVETISTYADWISEDSESTSSVDRQYFGNFAMNKTYGTAIVSKTTWSRVTRAALSNVMTWKIMEIGKKYSIFWRFLPVFLRKGCKLQKKKDWMRNNHLHYEKNDALLKNS